jgi:hypothetical protein
LYDRIVPARSPAVETKTAKKTRDWWLQAAPSALFAVLTWPLLWFPYFSDEFSFFDRSMHFHPSQLLPDPQLAFYRPISREIYFGILTLVGKSNPLLGHLINFATAIACVILVGSLARKLAGPRAGVFAGLFFASLGALPFTVGWISCSQDLLAMLFLLVTIHLQLARRTGLALVAFAAALLSKEAALLFLPAIVLMPGLLDRNWALARRYGLFYGGLVLAWVLVNRPLSSIAQGGFRTGAGGYIGLDNTQIVSNVARELAAVFNFPLNAKAWPTGLGIATLLAIVVLSAVALSLLRSRPKKQPSPPFERQRVLAFSVALGIIPTILTGIVAKHWWPYYACFPAIGTSLLLALGALRLGERTALLLVGVFFVLGLWGRGAEIEIMSPREESYRRLGGYLESINAQLHHLHPVFPDSSRLYMSVNMPEDIGLQYHLSTLQAPRVWYWNTTLLTDDPGRLHPGNGPEYLFSVTRDCQVFEVDLLDFSIKSKGFRPDYREYQSTIRAFVYGLAAGGKTDRAVELLLRMQEPDSLSWAFDRRLAATFLFASNRAGEAQALCKGLPKLPRQDAIHAVAAVLGPNLRGLVLDDAAFQAFGIPSNDPEIWRFLMNYFSDATMLKQTDRMARRLLALQPTDQEGLAMMSALQEYLQRAQDNSTPMPRR